MKRILNYKVGFIILIFSSACSNLKQLKSSLPKINKNVGVKTTPKTTETKEVKKTEDVKVETKEEKVVVKTETKTVKSSGKSQLLSSISDPALKAKVETYFKGGVENEIKIEKVKPDQVIETAKTYLGTPHRMNGNTKKGIECSGLVLMSFAAHGIELPHSAHEQGRLGYIIPKMEDLKKGDLVFFVNTYNTEKLITHSGIYIGDGKFIHASSKSGVIISPIDDPYYWKKKYLFATRLW